MIARWTTAGGLALVVLALVAPGVGVPVLVVVVLAAVIVVPSAAAARFVWRHSYRPDPARYRSNHWFYWVLDQIAKDPDARRRPGERDERRP